MHYLAGYANPTELSAPPFFFEQLCARIPKKCLAFRLAMSMDEYDMPTSETKIRPTPNTCRHYSRSDFESAVKRVEDITECETILKNTRSKTLPHLQRSLGNDAALDAIHLFWRAASRLFFGKEALRDLPAPKGRYTGDFPPWEVSSQSGLFTTGLKASREGGGSACADLAT